MLTEFLTTLAAAATQPKVVGAWLITLTLGLATVGDKVYVGRTEEMAILKTKLENIEATLAEINATTKNNQAALTQLLVEQARVRAQFESHVVASDK